MVKNKSSKKSDSTKTSRGKAAVQKGAKFEDTVAGLYRLLGAEVVQNIEICQKKVDILATFRLPGSPTGHRVIVECKDEKKAVAQNQRVMQFKGLLDTARQTGDADSAEIITRVPCSDQAKGFARESGIALLTYEEKIAQLIDFSSYLEGIVDRFEKGDPRRPSEPPLGAYYVDLSAEHGYGEKTEKIPVIDDYIKQWLEHNGTQQHLAILGEYGTGKTSWCQKLAHDLAASYLKTPGSSRIPILFNLREFTKTLKLESLVTSFLDEECGAINPRFKLFQAMNDAGIFLLVFDGFDEMAVRVDVDTLEMNLQEIEKLAASPKSKVILTSRLEYFISGEEEKKALRPKGELLAARETEYRPLRIKPWDDEQVNSFLKKRVPLIEEAVQPWTYYRDRIREIEGLSDLSRRPVLLEMIAKTLPQLITSGKSINRPNLYETYLMGEIKRQKILKKRTLFLPEPARFSLLKHLALDFFVGDISAITFTDALKHVAEVINPPKGDLEAYTREFLTCSFLIREGDEYQFSHRSIMEYLIARGLIEEIENDTPYAFKQGRLEPVVTAFLAELNPNIETLWNWIESTKTGAEEDIKYLGGNAVTLLCHMDRAALAGKDLSGAVLFGANLSSADLREANFNSCALSNVDFTKALFYEKDLTSAKRIQISLYVFGDFVEINKSRTEAYTSIREMDDQVTSKIHSSFKVKVFRIYDTIDSENYFGLIEFKLNDIGSLNSVKSEVATLSWVKVVSIYADELEKLFELLPKSLKYQIKEKMDLLWFLR
ncbi:MAG: NACHT domain-containing protein [Methanomicrobia archaeon]|nr:NACHT domain-containing protein [Methanomicrobia archaeon]